MDLGSLRNFSRWPLLDFDTDMCHAIYESWRTFWDRFLANKVKPEEQDRVIKVFEFFGGGELVNSVTIANDGETWDPNFHSRLMIELIGMALEDLEATTAKCNCDIYEHQRNLEAVLDIIPKPEVH